MGTLLTLGSMVKLERVDSESSDERPGLPETIGPYLIEARIGVGGMGEVYRAYDRRLDRHVAVKHIHPESAEDPKIRRRLQREAHAVAKLNHPAIVQIYDILENPAGDWIVMELIEGRTLHELAKTRQLNLAQALFLASEVADGLAEAHSKGVVHRDLKTENVMVTSAGHAKILDFGLAKLLLEGAGDTILSIHGTIVGTGRAMSPEQAKGESVDHRSDLFSLGSLLYELVAGRPPFTGTSIIATLTQICSQRPISVRELDPRLPQELSHLIDQLLEKNAGARPDNTAEVAAVLMDIAARLAPEQGEAAAGGPGGPRIAGFAATPTPTSVSRITHPESSQSVFVKTLVSVSLVDAPELPRRLGEARADEVFLRHEQLLRDLVERCAGTLVSKGGSFLLMLERPVDAVELALSYHRKLDLLADELGIEPPLRGRVGIHLGEIFYHEDDPAWVDPPFEVDAGARRTVVRTEALAHPGQSLMTQGAHDIARRAFARSSKASSGKDDKVWIAHGKYRFTQIGGTVRILEVRSAESPSLPPPQDNVEARRIGDPTCEILPSEIPPSPRRRRRLRAALTALACAALVAAFVAAVRLGDWPSSRTFSGEPLTIVIDDLRDFSTTAPSDALAEVLSEMLATHLAVGPGVRVASSTADPDYLVSGLCDSPAQDKVRIRLGIRDAAGGEPFIHEDTAAESDLPELIQRAGDALRQHLDLPALSTAERLAFDAEWPENRAALRLYAEGLAKARKSDPRRARDLLIRALARDPDHAPAHAALAEVLLALGETSRAEQSARRAYQRRAGLPRLLALRLEGVYSEASAHRLLEELGPEEARPAFEKARQHFEDAGDHARSARLAAELAALTQP